MSEAGLPAARSLATRTWTELGEPAVLLVPCGSCEQHGPHLPLDVDTRIAVGVATGLAEGRSSGGWPELLVGPALAIGASGEHAGFPGTLSIGVTGLGTVAVELARSADLFLGVVFVNAHGGNAAALVDAVATLTSESRNAAVLHVRVPGGDAHAGRTETSLMLHLAPGLVRVDRIAPGVVEPWSQIRGRVVASGVGAVSPSGVLGDPVGATGAEGRRMFDDVLAELGSALDDLVAGWAGE